MRVRQVKLELEGRTEEIEEHSVSAVNKESAESVEGFVDLEAMKET